MKILQHGTITQSHKTKFNYNAWPSVITLSDGTLLAGWSGDRYRHICPFGRVLAARSTDGGYTWQPPYTVQNTPLDDRDAGLCEANGHILLTSFNNSRAQQRLYLQTKNRNLISPTLTESYLDLITDEDEKRYLGGTLAVSRDNGHTFSDPITLPITSPHGPCVLKTGELLYVGRAFSDTTKASFDYLPEGIYAMLLSADGQILKKPWLVVPAAKDMLFCEPHAAVMPSGDILLAIRAQAKEPKLFTVYTCISPDNGMSFSTPQPTGWNGSPPHILVHSSGAVVMTYARRSAPFGQMARISHDNGRTWSEELVLRDDGPDGDLGYPCTAENQSGDLVTVYYQRIGETGNQIHYTIWTLDDKS